MRHDDPDEGEEGLERRVEFPQQGAEPHVAQEHTAYQHPQQHHPTWGKKKRRKKIIHQLSSRNYKRSKLNR